MPLLVSDISLGPGPSSSQGGCIQSRLLLIVFTVQASTGISTVVQVVTIDWFSSRRKGEWGMKLLRNDVKGNIKGRHNSTVYVPVIEFSGNKSLQLSSLRKLRNKELMTICYPERCTSRPFDMAYLCNVTALLRHVQRIPHAEESLSSVFPLFSSQPNVQLIKIFSDSDLTLSLYNMS